MFPLGEKRCAILRVDLSMEYVLFEIYGCCRIMETILWEAYWCGSDNSDALPNNAGEFKVLTIVMGICTTVGVGQCFPSHAH